MIKMKQGEEQAFDKFVRKYWTCCKKGPTHKTAPENSVFQVQFVCNINQ